ncbi:perilipin-4 [Suricata suricatta]|uniref:perilipin-4 n=1 Tax=Suricata suricatta TaxID=37032 RepID=UPI001155BFCC|nr:perilipin-4 [Suricata suricatta]
MVTGQGVPAEPSSDLYFVDGNRRPRQQCLGGVGRSANPWALAGVGAVGRGRLVRTAGERPYKAWKLRAQPATSCAACGSEGPSGTPAAQSITMSAREEGGRDPPKPKGKTLGSFLGSLPGFSSARSLMAGAHSSAKEARPVADPTAATSLEQSVGGETRLPPSDKMTPGANDLVSSKMTKTKDAISSGMANVVDTAKGLVQGGLGMTQSALTGAVDVAKGTVQTGLDTTKTVLTGTKDTVCGGVTEAMNVAKGAVQTGMDTSKTVLTGTKDTVSTGLTGALGMAKGTVQTGLDTTKNIVTGTKDTVSTGLSRAGTVARGAVQTGLGSIQNWLPGTQTPAPHQGEEAPSSIVSSTPDTLCAGLDLAREATAEPTLPPGATLGREEAVHVASARSSEVPMSFATLRDELRELGDIFHPMDAEEQAQLAASGPEPRVLTADQDSYFVRLGDLAPGFRQRALEHALSHLQHGQFRARSALAELEDTFRLIQKAEEQAPGAQLPPGQRPGSRVEEGATQEVPDSGALARACGLIQQLHVAYSGLAAGLQGVPDELQQRVGQARHSLCELYGLVSSASAARELPPERLARSREAVGRAWQELEQVLGVVQGSPPLCWLVGPFALQPGGQRL